MPKKKPPKALRTHASKFASQGGATRAQKLTPLERSESARNAAKARWAKRDKIDADNKGKQ